MIVTPSILTTTAEDVVSQINRLLPYFPYFQVDIADGKFVPNTTVQLEELIAFLIKTSNVFPHRVPVDFHLMVDDYRSHIRDMEKLDGVFEVRTILIHSALHPDYKALCQEFPNRTIGLVINPDESVQDFSSAYPLPTLSHIQIMSVVPGRQGNPFLEETLQKIKHLRQLDYGNKILLDGGINDKTLPAILSQEHVPDIIGPGSYLSQAKNIPERVSELRDLLVSHGQVMA